MNGTTVAVSLASSEAAGSGAKHGALFRHIHQISRLVAFNHKHHAVLSPKQDSGDS